MGSRRAFTLVEVIIVVAVLGILAAIVIPTFTRADVDAKIATAQTNLRTISIQVSSYFSDHAAWPTAIDPAWFPYSEVPPNPFDPDHPHDVQNFNTSVTHPNHKLVHSRSHHHGWWYNSKLGATGLRGRVSRLESDAASLSAYNQLNNANETVLGDYPP